GGGERGRVVVRLDRALTGRGHGEDRALPHRRRLEPAGLGRVDGRDVVEPGVEQRVAGPQTGQRRPLDRIGGETGREGLPLRLRVGRQGRKAKGQVVRSHGRYGTSLLVRAAALWTSPAPSPAPSDSPK